jgi:hypothetical protein
MPASQREVAFKSIQITRQCLDITVKSDSYREGMKYGKFSECHVSAWSLKQIIPAVHYTHATATFAASFLLRLARLL